MLTCACSVLYADSIFALAFQHTLCSFRLYSRLGMQQAKHADLGILRPALLKHRSEGSISKAGDKHLPLPAAPIPLDEAPTAHKIQIAGVGNPNNSNA